MNSNMTQNRKLYLTGFRFLIIFLLVVGVVFRFVNLDRKVYWYDETATSLRISGYTWAELKNQLLERVISSEDLQHYQRPNSDKGVINTIKGLAIEEPQHPPLYFLMTRFWVQWFGNSVAVRRTLPALLSLLVFPCLYWLCLELFKSPLVGWVAIALAAVSPLHVLYAQEARQYSLWTVTILLSSAALLRAIRLKTKLSWGIYAITVAVGLYTFLFSGLVAIGHGIYVVITEKFRLSKTVTNYLLASLAGVVAFTPWIFVVITNLSQLKGTTSWTRDYRSLSTLVKMWLINLSNVFLDLNYSFNSSLLFLYIIIILLSGYSIYFVCRNTPKQVWLFILTLIASTPLILILADLILKGRLSTISRYLIPCYLGIQIAIAYLFATHITSRSINIQRKKLWQIALLILTLSGVWSCIVSSQAVWWWNKYSAIHDPKVAEIVNQSIYPLFITSDSGAIQTLSYHFAPKVRLQLLHDQQLVMPTKEHQCQLNKFNIPGRFTDIFVYKFEEIGYQQNISNTLYGLQYCKIELVQEWTQETQPGYKFKASLWKLKNRHVDEIQKRQQVGLPSL